MTGLGDAVEKALTIVGVTEERVSQWLGRPCGCRGRREKLNALSYWAMRVLSGKVEDAAEQFDGLLSKGPADENLPHPNRRRV